MARLVTKRRIRGRKRSTMGLNKKAKRQVNSMIKRSSETKYHDLNFAGVVGVNVSNVGVTRSFTQNILEGTGNIERIGQKIEISSLQLRGTITRADSFNLVRFIVFQWMQDDNAYPPAITDILDPVPVTSSDLLGIYAPYNYNNSSNFRVLKDRLFTLNNQDRDVTYFKMKFKKFSRRKLTYDNATSDPTRGSLYMLAISDSDAITHPRLSIWSRLYFKDA